MQNIKQITRIPVAITASSVEELSKLCLKNNLIYQTEFHYFDIQKDGKKWIAWYYADIEKYHVIKL